MHPVSKISAANGIFFMTPDWNLGGKNVPIITHGEGDGRGLGGISFYNDAVPAIENYPPMIDDGLPTQAFSNVVYTGSRYITVQCNKPFASSSDKSVYFMCMSTKDPAATSGWQLDYYFPMDGCNIPERGINDIAFGQKYMGTKVLGLACGPITSDGITEDAIIALEQIQIRDFPYSTNGNYGLRKTFHTTYKLAKEGLYQSDFEYLYEPLGACPNPNWNQQDYPDLLGWSSGIIEDPGNGYARYTPPKYCAGKIVHNEREYTGFIAAGTSLGYIALYLGSEAGWVFRAAPEYPAASYIEDNTGSPYVYPAFETYYANNPGVKYVTAPIYVNGNYYIASTYQGITNIYISSDLFYWTKINRDIIDTAGVVYEMMYAKNRFFISTPTGIGIHSSFDGRVWTSCNIDGYYGVTTPHLAYNDSNFIMASNDWDAQRYYWNASNHYYFFTGI
jgi:hypothetical protein